MPLQGRVGHAGAGAGAGAGLFWTRGRGPALCCNCNCTALHYTALSLILCFCGAFACFFPHACLYLLMLTIHNSQPILRPTSSLATVRVMQIPSIAILHWTRNLPHQIGRRKPPQADPLSTSRHRLSPKEPSPCRNHLPHFRPLLPLAQPRQGPFVS